MKQLPQTVRVTGKVADYPLNGNLKNRRGRTAEMRRSASSDERPTFNEEGLVLDGDAWLHCTGTPNFSRSDPFTVVVGMKLPADLEEGVIFHQGEGAAIYNFRGFHLALTAEGLEVQVVHTAPYNAIVKRVDMAVPRGEMIQFALTYDGSSKATGLRLFLGGKEVEMRTELDNLYKDITFGYEVEPPLQVGARWRGKGLRGAVAGAVSVYERCLGDLEISHLAGGERLRYLVKNGPRSSRQSEEIYPYYQVVADKKHKQAVRHLRDLRRQQAALLDSVPEVMVMAELKTPRKAFILERGQYDAYGEEVQPGVIAAVGAMPERLPRNRLGLAKWLFLPENPLFARVTVNRYWQRYFGRGLVRTTEDFGSQGEAMSRTEQADLAITDTFIRLTGRPPRPEELTLLVAMQREHIAKFTNYPERMPGWLTAGLSRPDESLDAALVAANSVVASTILNLDATVVRR